MWFPLVPPRNWSAFPPNRAFLDRPRTSNCVLSIGEETCYSIRSAQTLNLTNVVSQTSRRPGQGNCKPTRCRFHLTESGQRIIGPQLCLHFSNHGPQTTAPSTRTDCLLAWENLNSAIQYPIPHARGILIRFGLLYYFCFPFCSALLSFPSLQQIGADGSGRDHFSERLALETTIFPLPRGAWWREPISTLFMSFGIGCGT